LVINLLDFNEKSRFIFTVSEDDFLCRPALSTGKISLVTDSCLPVLDLHSCLPVLDLLPPEVIAKGFDGDICDLVINLLNFNKKSRFIFTVSEDDFLKHR
jgi:hypothetical protein